MSTVQFFIPGDPRGKGRPKATSIGGHARVYTDAKTRAYEAQIAALARQAMAGAAPLSGPAYVEISVRLAPVASASKRARTAMLALEIQPTKKPDLDNVIKAVLDGMNGIVFSDDALVCAMRAEKIYAETAGVRVTVLVGGEGA